MARKAGIPACAVRIYYNIFVDGSCEVTSGSKRYTGSVVIPSEVVLKVPASAVEAYKSADQWKNFTIEAISDDEDAIECIHGVSKTEKIYTLNGMPINRADMKRGNVYIIKKDGRSRKYQF